MKNGEGSTAQAETIASVFHGAEEIPADFGASVVAIGNFDGVHLGHRAILGGAVEEARRLGVRAVAVTFDPHPEQVLRPASAPKLITPAPERLRLLAATGVDAVLVLHFDRELASVPAREFVRSILVGTLKVRSVHEGRSFRFGHGARAGVKELAEFGAEFNFGVRVHHAVQVHGLEVSSSAIRALIAAGDVRRARWMLGRPFSVKSTPAKGRGIGSKLLVPTVNLAPYRELLPAIGVYVTRLCIAGRTFRAVTNAGNRPTFGEPSFAIESHILDFETVDLDDQTPLKLEFLLRLRGEMTWPSPEALRQQIMMDVARAKRYFRMKNAG
ncbi:MAG TPA: bifunctional riboflavin kinase/FAD synthetase [Terracidiphilus sp.]